MVVAKAGSGMSSGGMKNPPRSAFMNAIKRRIDNRRTGSFPSKGTPMGKPGVRKAQPMPSGRTVNMPKRKLVPGQMGRMGSTPFQEAIQRRMQKRNASK